MRHLASFCEYFVITSGGSLRQVHAIADAVQESMAAKGAKPLSPAEATDESGWLVLDYGSVVCHVFHKPLREFYALEDLWSDAKRVRVAGK
jgi:ribosome-associated protein